MVDRFSRELNGVAGFIMRKQEAISGELHPACNGNLLLYLIFSEQVTLAVRSSLSRLPISLNSADVNIFICSFC